MRRKLQDNLKRLRHRIAEACVSANRGPDSVDLITVTKSVGLDVIRTLIDMGVTELGENRVQELTQRASVIRESLQRRVLGGGLSDIHEPNWHMIGRLQRNKVKSLLPWVNMIHSVDRLRLAEEINKQAVARSQIVDVLLEVNGGNEPQKAGAQVCAAPHLGEQMASMPGVRLRGLMTMAPLEADPTTIHNIFSRVRELFDEMSHSHELGHRFDTLSMGMSNDFELAVKCGATRVRIGTALFEGLEVYAKS